MMMISVLNKLIIILTMTSMIKTLLIILNKLILTILYPC